MKQHSKTTLRMTPQRIAIIKYLEGNKKHPSAEDIYKAVSKKFPTMSFATVYNTLSALKKNGSLLELTIDPDKKRFDPGTSPHHHLICIHCKHILDVQVNYHLTLPESDFEIIGNHVEFYGICPQCRANSPKDTSERNFTRSKIKKSPPGVRMVINLNKQKEKEVK